MRALGNLGRTVLRWRVRHAGRPPGAGSGADVIFIGDSITQFWLDGDPRFFLGGRVNVGAAGETTAEMRARFPRDVLQSRPRIVHIMGGTNDVWHGMPGEGAGLAIANVVDMVDRAKDAGIAVVLAAPPPISAFAEPLFGRPDLLQPLRDAVLKIARNTGSVPVDYAESLCDAAGLLVSEYTTDGVHLTREGYLAMRRQANAAIEAARRSNPAAHAGFKRGPNRSMRWQGKSGEANVR